jgi:DNA modification methylase
VIETVTESRASREASKQPQSLSLFDVYEGKEGDTFEEGWKNKLIWGDNLLVMGSLLEKFAGKIDLIYIDPPFATGTDFSFKTPIGEKTLDVRKAQSLLEEKAYRDTWGQGLYSYLEMIYKRIVLMRSLVSASGNILVHLDWNVVHYVKAFLDEVFGGDNFRNEIVWKCGRIGAAHRNLPKAHEVILRYSMSDSYFWNHPRVPYAKSLLKALKKDEKGWYYTRGRMGREMAEWEREAGSGLKTYIDPEKGKQADDVWDDVGSYTLRAEEKTGFASQKPEALLNRILEAMSNEGDLVADFFCGSGTTCAVAEKLGRRWIGVDLSRWAIHTTRKRILGIEGAKPFEVLNLGKYERKYWMGATFGKKGEEQRTIYEYIAFILKLYGAQPLSGMQHLHGKKGKEMVHVGAVDAPVTIDEVNVSIEECLAVNQSELHVLGWEWEMGMSPYIVQEAKRRGIKLLLLNIPREVMEQQAVDKGDIRFFELAHVKIDIKKSEERKLTVELTDFAFPYADLIREDVWEKITKWSDYVDYWAVDWDFQSDTFMQGWVAYRTRKERKLPLTSDPHTYEQPGTYTVMVKVVDIFGNDTSQTFEVTV